MERIDIHLEVPRVDPIAFAEGNVATETSAAAALRVSSARQIQIDRQGKCNGRLTDAEVTRFCTPDEAGIALLERSMSLFGFSARTRQRILKLARTIADLSGAQTVTTFHVSEAVMYRGFDRKPKKNPEPRAPY